MSADAVILEHLVKTFDQGRRVALNDVNARLRAGCITGLVGPDGAGKTTLMRMMAGLLTPDDGHIRVFGWDAVKDTQRTHSLLGYMPQRFGLYEDLSVWENLRLYADLRGLPAEDRESTFQHLLSFTGLEPFIKRLAGRLSGGMKQKLGLACTLLRRPRLLLLDEPSVGVDPVSRRELWRMVHDIVDLQTAVVWSTAYLDEAESCDQVILLHEGKMLFNGDPTQMMARVKGRVWKVDQIPPGHKRKILARAIQHPNILDGIVQGGRLRLVVRKTFSGVDEFRMLGESAARFMEAQPRFEDAFMDAVGGGPSTESPLARVLRPIAPSHQPVVVATGLTKQFGDFIAANDISFRIHRGEIFGLLGPNGAGKSTTFKMMCGLIKPTHGHGEVAGFNLRTAAAQARARIGYMAQKFSLYGNLSVLQNLRFFAGIYGLKTQSQATIQRLMDIFALGPYREATAGDLPLGFKQRLALACSVMHQPDVLFLDEPTSGVDPVTRREFWSHINGMVDRGVTVMITTHFLDEAEYCDRIGLVYRGRMIALGTPDELKQSTATPTQPDPSLEDAFIRLIQQWDQLHEKEAFT